MGVRTTIKLDLEPLRALGKRFHHTAAAVRDPSSPIGRAYSAASQILVGEVRDAILSGPVSDSPASVRTGALARSFREYVAVREGRVSIGAQSDLVYARIQDQGGRITPRTRKALAIPLIRLPAGKWPRHWAKGELFFLPDKRGGRHVGVLARQKGKRGKVEAVYALKRSVRIPPKHYLERAAKTALPKIGKYLARTLGDEASK